MLNGWKKNYAKPGGFIVPTLDVLFNQTTVHRLTVTRDGNVRIKIAKGSSDKEVTRIQNAFTKIAEQARTLNTGTLRGQMTKEDKHNTITLYTDSKREHHTYELTENGQD